MKISLNKIAFDVKPVDSNLRDVLLADEIISQAVAREVWKWDEPKGEAVTTVPTTRDRAVPLANGICFFVARPGANGAIHKADVPSSRMATRFLEAVGATSVLEVMQALNRIVNLPQKSIPVESFAWVRPVASFGIVMHVEYAVVELANAARNMSAYFFVPGQISFSHRVTDVTHPEEYAAALAAEPGRAANRPGFIVPAATEANAHLRRIAIAHRIKEIQDGLGGVHPNALPVNDPRRVTIALLGLEWKALSAAGQPKRPIPSRSA
jgi:hypothetical protein